MNYLALTLGGQ